MATIKAYTGLSQSKTLSKILPLESADMAYIASATDDDGETLYTAEYKSEIIIYETDDYINCWSLSALLSVLPKVINNETLFIETSPALWHIGYRNIYTARADNPVDACFELIIVNELNLL